MTENRRLDTLLSPLLEGDGDPPAASFGDACALLSEDEIIEFVNGQLNESALTLVSEHVGRCADCRNLVIEALHALHPREIDEEATEFANFAAGNVLAERYLIRRFVGKGAMGEVYEALDNNLKQRRVALKTVIATASDDERAESRLRDEVLLAQLISHPNVCRIHNLEVHKDSDGSPVLFLTMEFIDGESLGRRLRTQGPLSFAEAQGIARQLLMGLQAAHDANVLHRDFKSDNVMLRSTHDNVLQPVITDFGLARALDAKSNLLASDSRHVVGTIPYMAPEQLHGQRLGPPADLFAFGVVLYEMLTGRLPFKGGIRDRPLPPSRARRGVPALLDAFVLKCLKLEPEERYSSATQALADFERHCRRQPRWPLLAMGALSLSIGGAAWYGRSETPTPMPNERQTHELSPRQPPVVPASPVVPLAPAPEVTPEVRGVEVGTSAGGAQQVPPRQPKRPAGSSHVGALNGASVPAERVAQPNPSVTTKADLPDAPVGVKLEAPHPLGSPSSRERLLDPFEATPAPLRDAGARLQSPNP